MIQQLSKTYSGYMVRIGAIRESEKELYALGVEVILSTILSAMAIFLLGWMLHNLDGAVIFLLCFISMRNYSGGYHAKTRVGCFLATLCCYWTSWAGRRGLEQMSGSIRPVIILLLVCLIIWSHYQYAPVENKYKRLSEGWKRKNRIKTFWSLSIWLGISIIFLWFGNKAGLQILTTLLITTILILISRRNFT